LPGLSEGHTSKILCGLRKPSGETRDRLCAALGLLQSVSVDIERCKPGRRTKTRLTDDRPLKKMPNATRIRKSKGNTMSKVHSIPVRVPEELREKIGG